MTADSVPSSLAVASSSRSRMRLRWLVHVGLLATAAAALVTLQFLHIHNAIHAGVGFAFFGLVVAHLFQRRRTLGRWVTQFARVRPRRESLTRLLCSDALLAFITINVLVSGVVDWGRGQPSALPLSPAPFDRWHLLSGGVLVVYLIVHVWHRRRRLRRSIIQ